MWNWFRRWRARRYRQIYYFWDGRRKRAIDPLVVARRLLALDYFLWEEAIVAAAEGEDDDMALCARAVREAFDIAEFDGKNGLVEAELYGLLTQFTLWLQEQKKSTSYMRTWQPPMASQSSETSPTSAGLGSGETLTGSTSDPLPAFLKAYSSPSPESQAASAPEP